MNSAATETAAARPHEIRARINKLALLCMVRSSSPAEAAAKKAELHAAEAELTALHMATENGVSGS